jgi:hypothetical protein
VLHCMELQAPQQVCWMLATPSDVGEFAVDVPGLNRSLGEESSGQPNC